MQKTRRRELGCVLFVPQRDHRIDAHRALRWHVTRGLRNNQDLNRRAHESERIGCPNIKEVAGDNPSGGERDWLADPVSSIRTA